MGPGNPSGPVTFHMFILGNGRSNVTHGVDEDVGDIIPEI